MTAEKSPLVESLKSWLGLFRELAIMMVLVVLLFVPENIGRALQRAGFTSVDVAGIKLQLEQANQQTEEAKQTVNEVRQELEAARTEVRTIAQGANPAIRSELVTVSSRLAQSTAKVESAHTTLEASSLAQKNLIRVFPVSRSTLPLRPR